MQIVHNSISIFLYITCSLIASVLDKAMNNIFIFKTKLYNTIRSPAAMWHNVSFVPNVCINSVGVLTAWGSAKCFYPCGVGNTIANFLSLVDFLSYSRQAVEQCCL